MIDVLSMIAAHDALRPHSSVESAWDREARAAIAAATAQGIALREDDLVYFDVHDLQVLRWRIESGRIGRHYHGLRAA